MKPHYRWSDLFKCWVADREVKGWTMWLKPGLPVSMMPRF